MQERITKDRALLVKDTLIFQMKSDEFAKSLTDDQFDIYEAYFDKSISYARRERLRDKLCSSLNANQRNEFIMLAEEYKYLMIREIELEFDENMLNTLLKARYE